MGWKITLIARIIGQFMGFGIVGIVNYFLNFSSSNYILIFLGILIATIMWTYQDREYFAAQKG